MKYKKISEIGNYDILIASWIHSAYSWIKKRNNKIQATIIRKSR